MLDILKPNIRDLGVYVVEGEVRGAVESIAPQHLGVITASGDAEVRADTNTRLMLLGGTKIDGERHIWWNFVASSRELMEDAKYAEEREGKYRETILTGLVIFIFALK